MICYSATFDLYANMLYGASLNAGLSLPKPRWSRITVEKWGIENFGAILATLVATVIAGVRWLASKLYQRFEARMQALETRQDHHESELDSTREKLDNKITRVEDKIDAHYRVIDSKIESILHHIITRPRNSRDGDQS